MTAIVVLCGLIQQLTEPLLIDTSYRIYISQNKNALTEISNILLNKKGDITIINDSIIEVHELTSLERNKLKEGRKKLGVYIISKTNAGIYYGLWGFLDVRLGVIYVTDKIKPENNYRHLTGNWFRNETSRPDIAVSLLQRKLLTLLGIFYECCAKLSQVHHF